MRTVGKRLSLAFDHPSLLEDIYTLTLRQNSNHTEPRVDEAACDMPLFPVVPVSPFLYKADWYLDQVNSGENDKFCNCDVSSGC